MNGDGRRFGKGVAAALALHVLAAASLGLFAFRFTETPAEEIFTVELMGGGHAGGGHAGAGEKSIDAAEPARESVSSDADSWTEKREEIRETRPTPQRNQAARPAVSSSGSSGASNGGANGNGEGEGTGEGKGSGNGTGDGRGSGSGTGNGRGSGGGVGDGRGTLSSLPVPVSQPKPPYPPDARKAGVTGTAIVAIRIDAGGRVTEVSLYASSGDARLDAAAVEGVYAWEYLPARDAAGNPAPAYFLSRVAFTMQ